MTNVTKSVGFRHGWMGLKCCHRHPTHCTLHLVLAIPSAEMPEDCVLTLCNSNKSPGCTHMGPVPDCGSPVAKEEDSWAHFQHSIPCWVLACAGHIFSVCRFLISNPGCLPKQAWASFSHQQSTACYVVQFDDLIALLSALSPAHT